MLLGLWDILVNRIIAMIAVDAKSIRYNMDITRLKLSYKHPKPTRYKCGSRSMPLVYASDYFMKTRYLYPLNSSICAKVQHDLIKKPLRERELSISYYEILV